MNKLLTALIITLLLTACGKELEWRNAEISNGQVFEQGANEGFTGMVYNIPAQALVMNDPEFAPRFYNSFSMNDSAATVFAVSGSHCAADFKHGVRHGYVECHDARNNLVLEMLYTEGSPSDTAIWYASSGDEVGRIEFD